MAERFKEIFYEGLCFSVPECVYEPAEDTFLLARNLVVYDGEVVLDVGTGCGILAILAAFRASYVLAIDINPYAVKCAKENARRNGVLEKVDFICGNLFDPLRTHLSFDLILFNAPYLPMEEEPVNWLEYAWAGGRNGRRIIDAFLEHFSEHLKPGGRLLLVQSSLSGVDRTISMLVDKGYKVEVADTVKSFFETITLIKAVKPQR